jgi:hypothetical protein
MALPSFLVLVALTQTAADPVVGEAPPPIPFPPTEGKPLDVGAWENRRPPRPVPHVAQLPLTNDEVMRMSGAGFEPKAVVKLLAERRCACDVSPDALIALKRAGVDKTVILAMTEHALPANRRLDFEITLDFTGAGPAVRDAYLYFFVEDSDRTRVFTANLEELLETPGAHLLTVDRSEVLGERQVRRIVLPGEVPLHTYGNHVLLVVSSANPAITHPSQLTPGERSRAQSYRFDYPHASLQSLCHLTAGFRPDGALPGRWRLVGSRFECDWN